MTHNFLPGLLSPYPRCWFTPPASDFSFVLQEAVQMLERFPKLLELIEADLYKYALAKKERRIKDRQARYQQQALLPGTAGMATPPVVGVDTLADGRPRMSPRTCYLFLVIRGYLGGVKSLEARDFFSESLSLHLYLAQQGLDMPSRNTILENTNKVSQKTCDAILAAQIRWVKERGIDDFKDIMVDSTATQANSAWPTDSKLIWKYAERLWRGLQKVARLGLPRLDEEQLLAILKDLHRLDFEIACLRGKKDADTIREQRYGEFLDLAEVASQIFAEALRPLAEIAEQQGHPPAKQEKRKACLATLHDDLAKLDQLIFCAARRVLEKQKVPTVERILSLADPDAAFIAKGQRETQLGYRPQVSKSESGFVVAIDVPKDNAADAERLGSICRATFKRTGVIPDSISVDDGYTSLKNRSWLKEVGVAVVSFSGAKGKKITPEQEWQAEAYQEARRKRSAVESVIFQLKHCFEFGRVVRRGIERVRQELTAKVVAFNFYRLQYLMRV